MKTHITDGTFRGIPYKIYAHPDASRLIFINHGVYGNKERVLTMFGVSLAKLGYKVVAIDAVMHGQRGAPPFSTRDESKSEKQLFEVVKKTSEDILMMYHGMLAGTFETFDILGVSMGGYVAYHMTISSDRVDKLITLISSPDFSQGALDSGLSERELRKVEAMDPSRHVSKMRFKEGLALVGRSDALIPKSQTLAFLEKHGDLPLRVQTYDTTHAVTQAMQKDILTFLKQDDAEETNK